MDFWREIHRRALAGDVDADRLLREQVMQGNQAALTALGGPATGGTASTTTTRVGNVGGATPTSMQNDNLLNQILSIAASASPPVRTREVLRDVARIFRDLIPQVNIPTFEEAQAEIAAALAPIAEQARQQVAQNFEDLMRRVQAQQAVAGTAGSDVALRQLRALAQEQARAVSDIGERFSALAAEQAMNLIGQQLGAFQTLSEAQQRAVETATRMMDELARARLAPLQAANLFLDVARLQEAARQANLPYQYPTANALLPFTQPSQPDILQFILGLLGLTGGNLAGLGLTA